ncbi:hypothetical protein FB451DRAFT_1278904, partial [Mycena latifolia]
MAPGANYMGGKRNAARARSKDTSRVHKTFFSRQRLDILSKGLSGRAPSGGISTGYGPRVTASDIALSHARHPATYPEDQNIIPGPRSSSGSIRSSRVLEALDTTEPIAMRAAMSRILSIPDLAGLSTRQNVHTPPRRSKRTRRHDSDSCHPQEGERKRQKSQNAQSYSPSNSIQQDENTEEPGQFEPMGVDYNTADESDVEYSERDVYDYELIFACSPVQSSPSSLGFTEG